jgi:hypothetical protein
VTSHKEGRHTCIKADAADRMKIRGDASCIWKRQASSQWSCSLMTRQWTLTILYK